MTFVPILIASFKASIIILLITLVTAGMRRSGASRRHQLWLGALTATLVLTAGQVVLPAWHVSLLPERGPVAAVVAAAGTTVEAASRSQNGTPVTAERRGSAGYPRPPSPGPRLSASDHSLGSDQNWVAFVQRLLGAAYVGGVVICLGLLAGAHARIWSWVRRARAVDASRLPSMQALAGLRSRPSVRILESVRCEIPFTWGVRNPVIVVPCSSRSWSPVRWRAVLFHEFAHIRRGDGLARVLGDITCAFHWMNPLVWLAADRARQESEIACDQYVLHRGIRPSEYASELLALCRVARASRMSRRFASLVGRQGLARRVEALADGHGSFPSPGAGGGRAAAFMAAICLPLAPLTPAPAFEASAVPVRDVRTEPRERSALRQPPHQVRWRGPDGAGGLFLGGEVMLGPAVEGSAGDGFALLVTTDGSDLGRVLQSVAAGGRNFTVAGAAGRWSGVSEEDWTWVDPHAPLIAARLAGTTARFGYQGRPADSLFAGASNVARRGSVMRGFPAVSLDSANDVVQIGWIDGPARFGFIGRLGAGNRYRGGELADPHWFDWYVGFRWIQGSGELMVITHRDGVGSLPPTVHGMSAPRIAEQQLRAHLLERVNGLVRSQWVARH